LGLYERLKSDNKRILGNDGMRSITLYNANSESQVGNARITNPGMSLNTQGFPIASKKATIAFHIEDFATITAANETYKGWQAEFLNSEGETIKGLINDIMIDKTMGYVVATLTKNKVI
jgi:hypothetical protein